MAKNGDNQTSLQETNANTPCNIYGENIRTTKNNNIYLMALTSNLLSLSCGLSFGWYKIFFASYRSYEKIFELSDIECLTIASYIGASLIPIFLVPILIKFGRKIVLIASAISLLLSSLISAFASTALRFYIARLIQGIGVGAGFTVLPMYLSEISFSEHRGFIILSMYAFMEIGLNISYLLVGFVSVGSFSIICLIPLIAFLIVFSWWNVESPVFLASAGKHQQLKYNLEKMTHDVAKEIKNINQCLKAAKQYKSFNNLFEKSFYLVLMLFIFQIVAGGLLFSMYIEMKVDNFDFLKIEPEKLTRFIMRRLKFFTPIFSIILALYTIDKLGRKVLLLTSAIGSTVSLIILGVYFHLHFEYHYYHAFLVVNLFGILFLFFNYLGLLTVPWVILGEIISFPQKAVVFAVCVSLYFGFNYPFSWLVNWYIFGLRADLVTWIFAITNVISVPFVFFLIPETKKKSLQEIEQILNSNIE